MPKTLWNEGRVVGYSAYELYVRHAIATDPDHKPASEIEWLSSMIAMGSSMILHIGTDDIDKPHYRDFQLPDNSTLCAANMIIASLFFGHGISNNTPYQDSESGWITKVDDFGILIDNNSSSYPKSDITSSDTVPPSEISKIPETVRSSIMEYAKIVDGIVIQPGTWTDNPNKPPEKDFSPNLTDHPRLRIAFSKRVDHPFFVMFTGFTNRSIISGLSYTNSAINTASPDNGDFLGPCVFPWASKIMFYVPAAYMSVYMCNSYSRAFPANSYTKDVTESAIIDMETSQPSAYYMKHDTDSAVSLSVKEFVAPENTGAVLGTYQATEDMPPALYGTIITGRNTSTTYPYFSDCTDTIYAMAYSSLQYINSINHTMSDSDWESIKFISENKDDADYVISPDKVKNVWNELCGEEYNNSIAKELFYTNFHNNCAFLLFPASKIETLESYLNLLNSPDTTFSEYQLHDDIVTIDSVDYFNLTVYSKNRLFSITFGIKCDDVQFPNAMYPIDTVAPGTVKLYHSSNNNVVSKALSLEQNVHGNTALIRNSSDYTIHQIGESGNTIPVAQVDTAPIQGMLTIYELGISPYMVVDGENPRDGVSINKLDGYDSSKSVWDNAPATYEITYNGVTRSGTYILEHPECKLEYCEPMLVMQKRIVGNLSSKIQELCGYEYDTATKKLKSGGYWDNATLDLSSIPENQRTNYYYIIPAISKDSNRSTNSFVWPVRKSDHHIDVLVPYTINIYATAKTDSGVQMNQFHIPSMVNDGSAPNSSKLLGGLYANGVYSDNITYNNKWAYIHIDGVTHPRLKDTISEIESSICTAYQGDSMLPVYSNYTQSTCTAKSVYGTDALNAVGILPKYQNMTLYDFLGTAITTDLGTGEMLSASQESESYYNRAQPIILYTNGKTNADVFLNAGTKLCTLPIKNTVENRGKVQSVILPKQYRYDESGLPHCTFIQCGENKATVLSMSDSSNSPYSITGSSGDIRSNKQGSVTWENLLDALAQNKTLNILDTKSSQLCDALSGCGDGTYRIKISGGKVTLVAE